MREGEPWWIAAEVCEVLDYSGTQAATSRLDIDEVGTCTDNSSGQIRNISIVSESGLYSLVSGSRKPEAKSFNRWITHEVIPSIPKNSNCGGQEN